MDATDRTAAARIRDAAIRLFGTYGFQATTIRDVAESADVSPALVMHHFGNKEGLRQACDEWIWSEVDPDKTSGLDMLDPESVTPLDLQPQIAGYIAATLRENGRQADQLFDRLCKVADNMMTHGDLRLADVPNRDEVLAVTTAYSCGAIMMGAQVARKLGGSDLFNKETAQKYSQIALLVFTSNVVQLSDDTRQRIAASLESAPDLNGTQPSE